MRASGLQRAAFSPEADQRLLDDVLGLLEAAEHACAQSAGGAGSRGRSAVRTRPGRRPRSPGSPQARLRRRLVVRPSPRRHPVERAKNAHAGPAGKTARSFGCRPSVAASSECRSLRCRTPHAASRPGKNRDRDRGSDRLQLTRGRHRATPPRPDRAAAPRLRRLDIRVRRSRRAPSRAAPPPPSASWRSGRAAGRRPA